MTPLPSPPPFTFTIPGNPIPQKRHRHKKLGSFITTYDPNASDKKEIKKLLMKNLEQIPLFSYTPLSITVNFYLPVPHSLPNKQRNKLLWDYYHTSKPDYDNLAKLYLDAAKGVLYPDDGNISLACHSKCYSTSPHTTITIKAINMDNTNEQDNTILSLFNPDTLYNMLQTFNGIFMLLELPEGSITPTYISQRNKEAVKAIKSMAIQYADILQKVKKEIKKYEV